MVKNRRIVNPKKVISDLEDPACEHFHGKGMRVKVNKNLPHDDFYLQWEHIFWWQVKFNLAYAIREAYNDLLRRGW